MKLKSFIVCSLMLVVAGNAATTNDLPKADELITLLRSNLNSLSATELDRALVQGILRELGPRAVLEKTSPTNAASSGAARQVGRTAVYENAFGYIRIEQVSGALAEKLKTAYQELGQTNKLKGIVLDLRFATGEDYAAAAKAADLFLNSEQPLIHWNDAIMKSTRKTNAIAVPVAILVNKLTSGAAESLAGALREAKIGLLIGATTAGQANIYKDFPLSNGQRLRIAVGQVKVGNEKPLPADGLTPDIDVSTSVEEEKMYLEDAYRVLSKPLAGTEIGLGTNTVASAGDTNNAARRRLNEAELVRLRREGLSDEEISERPLKGAEAALRLINDPALARALDLLKGLSVVQPSRPL